jgi:hypothetical protein
MKQPLIVLTPALAAVLLATNARADDTPPASSTPSSVPKGTSPILRPVDAPADHSNWFSLGPQFGLNLNARFNHVGNANPGSATGGANQNYADGYVNVDSAANLGGLTWNWGYQNAAQVQGGMLLMHIPSAAVDGTLGQNDDPQMGFDLAFGHDFGKVLGGKWGLQAAFDFTEVSMSANGPVSGTGRLITDAYQLGVVIPPPAPYSGSYYGPGPLIGDTPTRTMGPAAVMISGPQSLDGQIYALRAGPYYDFQFCKRWSGRLGGGVSLAVADLNYSFNETIAYGSGLTINNAGSGAGAEFQAGGYVEGKLLFALTRHASVFAGAQYEYLGTFSRTAGNEQAQLDMSNAVYLLLGVEWHF